MNKLFKYTLLLCFASKIVLAQTSQKKVVFIIADGLPADVVERVHTPHLDAIAKEGRYMRAYVGGEKDSYSKHLPYLL